MSLSSSLKWRKAERKQKGIYSLRAHHFWSTCALSAKSWTFLEGENKRSWEEGSKFKNDMSGRENKRDIRVPVKFNKSLNVR